MVSLREIRKRIHSVNNIEQITKAMEMVAGARLNKAEIRMRHSLFYFEALNRVMDKLASSYGEPNHPYLRVNKQSKTGVIIISGDKGLCGSYHTHLFSKTDRFLSELPGADLFLIGRKGVSHYQKKTYPIAFELQEWGGKISSQEVYDLAQKIAESYIHQSYSELWIIYTKYISVISRKVVIEKFLGLEPKTTEQESIITEPEEKEVFESLIPRWLAAKLQNALDEAYASELAARVISMKTASKNAEEMIQKLTLVRNKVRQENITKEITEIISGTEGVY